MISPFPLKSKNLFFKFSDMSSHICQISYVLVDPKTFVQNCHPSFSTQLHSKINTNPNTVTNPRAIKTYYRKLFPLIYSFILRSFNTVRFIKVKITPISNKKYIPTYCISSLMVNHYLHQQ